MSVLKQTRFRPIQTLYNYLFYCYVCLQTSGCLFIISMQFYRFHLLYLSLTLSYVSSAMTRILYVEFRSDSVGQCCRHVAANVHLTTLSAWGTTPTDKSLHVEMLQTSPYVHLCLQHCWRHVVDKVYNTPARPVVDFAYDKVA